jgi:hypothetical protein
VQAGGGEQESGAAQQREDRAVGGEIQHFCSGFPNRKGVSAARTNIFRRFCDVRTTFPAKMPVTFGETATPRRSW